MTLLFFVPSIFASCLRRIVRSSGPSLARGLATRQARWENGSGSQIRIAWILARVAGPSNLWTCSDASKLPGNRYRLAATSAKHPNASTNPDLVWKSPVHGFDRW